jgi:hypothetical protein
MKVLKLEAVMEAGEEQEKEGERKGKEREEE